MEVGMQPVVQMRFEGWTIADVQALDVPDWWNYEIVDGALVVSPAAAPWHELVSEEVRAATRVSLAPDLVVIGPAAVDLGASYLIPDLVVVRRAEVMLRTTKFVPSDVLIAVEVVSPSSITMDRLVKPAKYSAAGIRAYWRVETDPVSLTAYVLRDGTYAELGTWRAGEVAEIAEPFPVSVDLNALLLPD